MTAQPSMYAVDGGGPTAPATPQQPTPDSSYKFSMPDTVGHQEGQTWTATQNGVKVTNTIPVGNGNQTVDQTFTDANGATHTIRYTSNGQGGLQAWSNSSDGTGAYLSKDTADPNENVYTQLYKPGQSTSGMPNYVTNATPDFNKQQTAALDSHGNITTVLDSAKNSRGNFDGVAYDSQGNRTLFGDLPDGHGGLLHNATIGQINSEGVGWEKDITGVRWNVTPDINGAPGDSLLWRTATSQDGGSITISRNNLGVETREYRAKDTNAFVSKDIFDPDKTITHLGADGSKTTRAPDGTTTMIKGSGEMIVIGPDGKVKDHKLAPGVKDVPGWIDNTIDKIEWNPFSRGADKAVAHMILGAASLVGTFDSPGMSENLNLPTREQSIHGLGSAVQSVGMDALYLQMNMRDRNGNRIYSPDGSLDEQHAVLNEFNDLSKLLIGTDWSDFRKKPWETIGSAAVGIGSWIAPEAPKALGALSDTGHAASVLTDSGHAAVPDLPWPDQPGLGIDSTSVPKIVEIGGVPYLQLPDGLLDLSPAVAADADRASVVGSAEPGVAGINTPDLNRSPWDMQGSATDSSTSGSQKPPGWGPGTPHVTQPPDGGGLLQGLLDRLGIDTSNPLKPWKLPRRKKPSANTDPKPLDRQPRPSQREVERITPPSDRDGMEPANNRPWIDASGEQRGPNTFDLSKYPSNNKRSSIGGFIGDALTRARIKLKGWDIIAAGEDAKIPIPGTWPPRYFKPDYIVRDPSDGKLILIESKFNGSTYELGQLYGYSQYSTFGGLPEKVLEIDAAANITLEKALIRNGIDPRNAYVKNVETFRWNRAWAPSDDVLYRAADDPGFGNMVRGNANNPEWRDSAFNAFYELNAAAAIRAEQSGDLERAFYYRSRQQIIDWARSLPPNNQMLQDALIGSMVPNLSSLLPPPPIQLPGGSMILGDINSPLNLAGASLMQESHSSSSLPQGHAQVQVDLESLRNIVNSRRGSVDQSVGVNITIADGGSVRYSHREMNGMRTYGSGLIL